MPSIANLTASSRPVSPSLAVQGPSGLARDPVDAPASSLRPSGRSFLARLRGWLGLGGQGAANPATLLERLRPPSTGRLSFFFGRLSRLSGSQLAELRREHGEMRGDAPGVPRLPAAPIPVPASLLTCLGRQAVKKPEEIFDAVCELWKPAGAPQVADWQREARAFLRGGDSCEAPLQALRMALLEKNPGQGAAQVDARAQAIYAAMVGSVAHHAAAFPAHAIDGVRDPAATVAGPLDDFKRRIDALAAMPVSQGNLLARVEGLAGIQIGLEAVVPDQALAPALQGLQDRCREILGSQQMEVRKYLDDDRASFGGRQLEDAQGQVATAQAHLDTLRTAMAALRQWPDASLREACERQVARLQADLDAVAGSTEVLARYLAIQEPDPQAAHKQQQPCAPLAHYLRTGTVSSYCEVQGQIDHLCAMAPPVDHPDFLATLASGILSASGEVLPNLVKDLLAGNGAAVKTILRDAQWDGLAGTIRLAAANQREQAALDGVVDPQARADIIARFSKERFAIGILNRQRELNSEINRLVALKDPQRRFDLVGDAGAMPAASEAAIDEIRQAAGGLSRKADVLMVNWIYCSCLNPATMEIDQVRVRALWEALKGQQAPVPGLEKAQELLGQGFLSFDAVRDVHKRIEAFSKLVADAQVLAAASHAHDPRVRAQGMVGELHARLTGRNDVDPADAAFGESLKQSIDSARNTWLAARQGATDKRDRAVESRNGLVAKLQGQQWKFDLAPDGHLQPHIEGSRVSQREKLDTLVRCLRLVAFMEQEGAARTPEARQRVARLHREEFEPLADKLAHFDPQDKRLKAAEGARPGYGNLKRLLGDLEDLEALLRAEDDIVRLDRPIARPQPESDALAQVVEGVVRVAVLEGAIAQASPDADAGDGGRSATLADDVLKCLDLWGLGLADPNPVVAEMVGKAVAGLKKAPDLTELCKRLDPVNPEASGVLQSRIPGAPTTLPGAKGLMARARAYVQAGQVRRRLDNQQAVTQRFASLQSGQAFDIQLGRTGEVTIGAPVVPGVSVAAGVSATRASAIRVSRTGDESFEIDVVRSRSATVSAALSLLAGAVVGSSQHSAEAATGYRIQCTSRQEALELVEALAGMRKLDATTWQSGQVQQLRSQSGETRAAVEATFEAATPADSPLFKLEAELSKAWGQSLEVAQSPFIRVERRTQVGAWHAHAGIDVLEGRLAGEVERGAQVSATRTCVRRKGLLNGEPVLSEQSRLTAGDAKACLLRIRPRLAGTELEHYVAQVQQAHAAAEEAGQTLDVELESVMTPEGVRKANHFYRQAEALLRAPGRDPAVATAQARVALEEAEREMREPANYEVRGLAVVLKSESLETASEELPLKETARVGSETRQALAPFAGQSWKLLP